MSNAKERLLIRLPIQASQPVHWAIWRRSDQSLIASGELANAQELERLRDHAQSRETTIFVAGQGVKLCQVTVPSGNARQLKRNLDKIIPFALEDELASDIEQLHFAWPSQANVNPIPVAVVNKSQMQDWKGWLQQAGIEASQWLPDCFMLPYTGDNEWHAIQLGQDIIVRTGAWQGFSIEADLFEHVGAQLAADAMTHQQAPQHVIHYGELEWPNAPALMQSADIEVPFSIAGQSSGGINLLQGKFKTNSKRQKSSHNYWPLAIAATVTIALGLGMQITQWWQLNQESERLQAAIEQTYRDTFPSETRLVNVRSQLNQHLRALEGASGGNTDMLALLQQLEPALAQHDSIEFELLRFDATGNSTELRVQVLGDNYAQLDSFRQLAQQAGTITVEQGQTSSQDDRVSSAFTIAWAQTAGGNS